MNMFYMNGYLWRIEIVDPLSPMLVDRTGKLTVATTDSYKRVVYLSANLQGDFLITVLIHELGHCALFSFNLLPDIHRMVKPEYWLEAEEWICNFLADYGRQVFEIARQFMGNDAWIFIPSEFERLIS